MKILHVINNLSFGGAEILLKDLIISLNKEEFTSEVYVLQHIDNSLERSLITSGITIYGPNNLSIYSPAQVLNLIQHFRHHHYHLVHVHLFPSQLWVALATTLARIKVPLITTEHSTFNRRRRCYFQFLDRWIYAQYQKVICISGSAQDALVEWIPAISGKTRIIYNGIPYQRFALAQKQNRTHLLGVNDDVPLILTIGRLECQKDHATLIRAISQIEGVHLAIVGDGSMREELVSLVQNLDIAKRVHFLGFRTDIPQIIKAADIYVQSSHWEGFNIATLEAMAGGLPVVASRVPGLADVVGTSGLLFDVGDELCLVRQIKDLLDNPSLRLTYSQMGKQRAREFDITRMQTAYISEYYDQFTKNDT